MEIVLKNVGRSFGNQTIFSNINYRFHSGGRYAILGGNGSGKSTLLKVILGALTPSEGTLAYITKAGPISVEKLPFEVALTGPYLELIEELTPLEFIELYRKFRTFQDAISSKELLQISMLTDSSDKLIRNFSSGMKQRLKLVLAILSDAELILLDEPTSNLDPQGTKWYQQLLRNYLNERTLIVGSNFDENEIFLCTDRLELKLFK